MRRSLSLGGGVRCIAGVLLCLVAHAAPPSAVVRSAFPDALPSWEASSGGFAWPGAVKGEGTLSWTQATPAAPWPAERWGRAVVVFDNKIWLLGGDAPVGSERHDIWYSGDGTNWTEALAEAPWGPRGHHGSVVFHDRIWIVGGLASYTGGDDVWSSPDGVNWTLEVEEAPWGLRESNQCLVYDNKIWIYGGASIRGDYQRSVWNTADGVIWTEVGDVPWEDVEFEAGAVRVFQDEMWMLGAGDQWGLLFNVWRSTDGLNWDYVAPMPPAAPGNSVLLNGHFFLLGGWYSGSIENRVWSSPDASAWSEVLPAAPWTFRSAHGTAVLNNKIWVLGGYYSGQGYLSDVWYGELLSADFSADAPSGDLPLTMQFTDASTWFSDPITEWAWDFGDDSGSDEQNPIHTYTTGGAYTISLTVTSAFGTDTETKTDYVITHAFHNADQDQDNAINLSELLRMIQFFNSPGLHCQSGTEDGYAPGPGDAGCALHDGDYAPPDWQIDVTELLRVIQFYNSDGYHVCPAEDPPTEDGYCVGL